VKLEAALSLQLHLRGGGAVLLVGSLAASERALVIWRWTHDRGFTGMQAEIEAGDVCIRFVPPNGATLVDVRLHGAIDVERTALSLIKEISD
jgi:hypothetical protein